MAFRYLIGAKALKRNEKRNFFKFDYSLLPNKRRESFNFNSWNAHRVGAFPIKSFKINSPKSYRTFYTVWVVWDLIKVLLHLLYQWSHFNKVPLYIYRCCIYKELLKTDCNFYRGQMILEHLIACPHVARANFNL